MVTHTYRTGTPPLPRRCTELPCTGTFGFSCRTGYRKPNRHCQPIDKSLIPCKNLTKSFTFISTHSKITNSDLLRQGANNLIL